MNANLNEGDTLRVNRTQWQNNECIDTTRRSHGKKSTRNLKEGKGKMRLIGLMALAVACGAMAEKPVYKCVNEGKTNYSNVPCLDATVIDTTPTRGLDKSSGKSRKGIDVQAEERRQQMSEQFYKPVFGETGEATSKRHKRSKMTANASERCYKLDPLMKTETGQKLFDVRKEYLDLNC